MSALVHSLAVTIHSLTLCPAGALSCLSGALPCLPTPCHLSAVTMILSTQTSLVPCSDQHFIGSRDGPSSRVEWLLVPLARRAGEGRSRGSMAVAARQLAARQPLSSHSSRPQLTPLRPGNTTADDELPQPPPNTPRRRLRACSSPSLSARRRRASVVGSGGDGGDGGSTAATVATAATAQ